MYQDLTEIISRLPVYVKYAAKAVTDLDATISKVTGAGQEPEPEQDDLEILTNFVTDILKNTN